MRMRRRQITQLLPKKIKLNVTSSKEAKWITRQTSKRLDAKRDGAQQVAGSLV